MVLQAVKDIHLNIAGGAHLQVQVVFIEEFKKVFIFNTPDPVPDSLGMKIFQGFPYALRTAGFPCVGGTRDAEAAHQFKGLNMGVYREACFGPR